MVGSVLADVFLHKMPTSLMLTIRTYDRTYISVLAKECDCTYPHAVKTLWTMEKLGLVQSEKVGRVKYVRLTDHGKTVADSLNALVHSLDVNDAPRRDDVAYINQKINNVIRKVETIQKELEAGKTRPSFRTRSVSKFSTCSPALILASMASDPAICSLGHSTVVGLPMISSLE